MISHGGYTTMRSHLPQYEESFVLPSVRSLYEITAIASSKAGSQHDASNSTLPRSALGADKTFKSTAAATETFEDVYRSKQSNTNYSRNAGLAHVIQSTTEVAHTSTTLCQTTITSPMNDTRNILMVGSKNLLNQTDTTSTISAAATTSATVREITKEPEISEAKSRRRKDLKRPREKTIRDIKTIRSQPTPGKGAVQTEEYSEDTRSHSGSYYSEEEENGKRRKRNRMKEEISMLRSTADSLTRRVETLTQLRSTQTISVNGEQWNGAQFWKQIAKQQELDLQSVCQVNSQLRECLEEHLAIAQHYLDRILPEQSPLRVLFNQN